MESLKLHLGIIQRIIFALLKAARMLQSSLSTVYWRIFCIPFLWLGWKIWGGKENNKTIRHINFHKEKTISYIYSLFIGLLLKLNSILNGLQAPYTSYEFLLGWNPKIPLIALRHTKITYQISTLGKEREDNKGWYPVIDGNVISTSEVSGHFMIVDKKLEEKKPERVIIECIWLTGETKGQKFTIGRLGQSINNSSDQTTPDAIYFPPHFIVWLFEIIISLSAVLALIGLCINSYNYIYSYFSTQDLPKLEIFYP